MKHKIWGYLALAFVAFFILSNPSHAADTASTIGGRLAAAATSMGEFFTALAEGGGH